MMLCHQLQVETSPKSRNKTQKSETPGFFSKPLKPSSFFLEISPCFPQQVQKFKCTFPHRTSTATKEIKGCMWGRIGHGTYFWGYNGVCCFREMDSIPTDVFSSFAAGLSAGLATRHLNVIIVWRSAVATTGHQWTWETCRLQIDQDLHLKDGPQLPSSQWCWSIFRVCLGK